MTWKPEGSKSAKPPRGEEARILHRAMASQGWSEAEIHKALLEMGINEEEIRSWEEEEDFGSLDH